MNSKEDKNSISEGKIREVANRIFVGDITWEQAAKTLKMAEKTLRKQVSELCKKDEELRRRFFVYSTTRRNKHEEINMPAVIIDMVEKEKSLFQMAETLGITKESLRTLIKKQQDPILNDLLREHFDRKKHKKLMEAPEKERVQKKVKEYIFEHPEYIPKLKLDSSSIQVEKTKVDSFLFEVEKKKSGGMTEKAKRGGVLSIPGFGYKVENGEYVIVPEEGSYLGINQVNITKSCKNPELAYKFISWLISYDVQYEDALARVEAPANTKVELTEEQADGMCYGDAVKISSAPNWALYSERNDAWILRYNEEIYQ